MLRAWVHDQRGADKLFDANGKLVNDGTRKFLHGFMQAYAAWITANALASQKGRRANDGRSAMATRSYEIQKIYCQPVGRSSTDV